MVIMCVVVFDIDVVGYSDKGIDSVNVGVVVDMMLYFVINLDCGWFNCCKFFC